MLFTSSFQVFSLIAIFLKTFAFSPSQFPPLYSHNFGLFIPTGTYLKWKHATTNLCWKTMFLIYHLTIQAYSFILSSWENKINLTSVGHYYRSLNEVSYSRMCWLPTKGSKNYASTESFLSDFISIKLETFNVDSLNLSFYGDLTLTCLPYHNPPLRGLET